MDKQLLDLLACPVCGAPLEEVWNGADQGLLCTFCFAIYPVRDEIPLLLADEAVSCTLWSNRSAAGGDGLRFADSPGKRRRVLLRRFHPLKLSRLVGRRRRKAACVTLPQA
ncbi:MAG: hypothetical protein LBC55_01690 [Desulfovibrio sp.]|nr:hypothetical protein [Desulfovibrio sp.]